MKFTYASGSRPLDGYTIKRGIGVGGFGEVYFALSDGGKEVALKRVQRNLEVEVRGVSQCLNLKHPNLIALYDLKYDADGQAWVVMEFVGGESLKEVLDRSPDGLPHDEAERWFRQIVSGVGYLHDHGIVHRDLKPGNIFSDEDVVKIGDYGLSKFIACSRRSGHTESVGTFHYMAPEIGKGVYGKEIDVYALGIILHELLTGRVPFEGETSQEIIMKHLTADPDLSDLPQPYRGVVRRALLKDPEKRFNTVEALLAALDGNDSGLLSSSSFTKDALPAGATPASGQGPSRAADSDPDIQILGAAGQVSTSPPPATAGRHAAPPRPAGRDSEPLYIGEDTPDPDVASQSEMVMGPVRQRPADATPPLSRQQSTRPTRSGPRRLSQIPGGQPQPWYKTAGKIGLFAAVVVLLLIVQPAVALPVLAIGGAAFLMYYGVRFLVEAINDNSTTGDEQFQQRWQQQARQVCRQKATSEHISELTGSWLSAATVCGILGVLLLALGAADVAGSIQGASLFFWFFLVTTLGSWALLTLGKFWERSEGESIRRRFSLLAFALIFGAVAYACGDYLRAPLDSNLHTVSIDGLPQAAPHPSWYASDGAPLLPAFLAYFGGLFVILRWWRQADPLRATRVSLLATTVCVAWAWVLHMLVYFPQPWGIMLAGTISIATQLSAPWMKPQERNEIRQQLVQG